MCQSFANIVTICGRSDREDNTWVKVPTVRRFVISRECLQEWSVESALEDVPGPAALLGWMAKSVLSKSIVGL